MRKLLLLVAVFATTFASAQVSFSETFGSSINSGNQTDHNIMVQTAISYDFLEDEEMLALEARGIWRAGHDTSFAPGFSLGLDALHIKVNYDIKQQQPVYGLAANFNLQDHLFLTPMIQITNNEASAIGNKPKELHTSFYATVGLTYKF